jgi:hypothetical protein
MADNEKTTPSYEEGKVYSTEDYGLFHYIDSNRTINKSHVNHLIQSFENNPSLIQTRPILVNENMEVIDGQHRLQAASTLRLPVYFMLATGTNIESAQQMNALQRGWSLVDFARSYALNSSNPERAAKYKKFLALLEEYNIPLTVLLQFVELKARGTGSRMFKEGKLSVPDEERTRTLLEQEEDIRDVLPSRVLGDKYAILSALFKILTHPDYNHERMLTKIQQAPVVEPQKNRVEYLRAFEAVYNWHMSTDDSRVRFF